VNDALFSNEQIRRGKINARKAAKHRGPVDRRIEHYFCTCGAEIEVDKAFCPGCETRVKIHNMMIMQEQELKGASQSANKKRLHPAALA
jgi:CDGSH-type Zn-finger protein